MARQFFQPANNPHPSRASFLESCEAFLVSPRGRKHRNGSAKRVSSRLRACEPKAEIRLHNYRLFTKLLAHGGIGVGESFVNGDWSSPDLSLLLKVMLNNWHVVGEDRLNLLKPLRWL